MWPHVSRARTRREGRVEYSNPRRFSERYATERCCTPTPSILFLFISRFGEKSARKLTSERSFDDHPFLSLSLVSYMINPFHPDWYVNWRVVLTELLLIPPMKTMKPGFTWSGHHFTETPPWWWHVAPWDKGGERRYRPLEISNPKVMDRSERERDIPRYAWKNVSSMGSAVWGPVFNPSSSSSRYLARVITPLPCFVKGRNGTT